MKIRTDRESIWMGSWIRELRYYLHLGALLRAKGIVRIAKEYLDEPSSLPWFEALTARLKDAKGLEIGGPSRIFQNSGRLPVYQFLDSCDNVDFASETIWSSLWRSRRPENSTPVPNGAKSVSDATQLPAIRSGSYDVVLNSHVIEHLANPIRALKEWKRVLKPGGSLLVIVPDASRTFDHRRRVTRVDHISLDYRNEIDEDDMTHLPEILELHDLALDPRAGSWEQFVERSRRNPQVRALHHHVFTLESLGNLLRVAGFNVDLTFTLVPDNLVAFAVPELGQRVTTEKLA